LIARIRSAARQSGVALPDDSTLRITLSGWENGRHRPSLLYRRLLATALEMTEADLGFGPARSAQPAVLGPRLVDYLNRMFALHARADQDMGSRLLLDVVDQQTRQAEEWVRDARGAVQPQLIRTISRYAELCGWLHQDQGDFATADRWTRHASELSQELGDQRLVSYALTRRSNIATESGRPGEGLRLAEAALRQRADLDSRVRALALRQKAFSHAMLGESQDCRKAVDEGVEAAVSGVSVTHPESDYCTVSYMRMEGAQALLTIGRPADAIQLFGDALQGWPNGQQRDRGLCLARLANAYAQVGSIDASCETAHEAVSAVQFAPSARTASNLRQLCNRLEPYRRRAEVARLRESLQEAV
jgi:tetratricopeptide (TPR) repeat protein